MKFYHKNEKDHHVHDNHHECGPDCNHDHHHHHHHHHDDDEDDTEESFKQDKVKVNIIPEKKSNEITFANFLNFFPVVQLPYSITSDTQRIISIENDPLSAVWMANFVLSAEEEEIDEYTEYMPCFALPIDDFFALVYWEAGLEGSSYNLITYSKTGVMIDKARIAGTKYAEDGLYQTVCTISPNWLFSCAEGRLDEKGNAALISPTEKLIYIDLQLTNDGEIITI